MKSNFRFKILDLFDQSYAHTNKGTNGHKSKI